MKKNLYRLFSIVFTIGFSIHALAQSTTRVITTIAGNGMAGYFGDGSPALTAMLDSPTCIVRDESGNLYINDQRNNCVRKVNPAGIITTIAGTGIGGYYGDGGAATMAQLSQNWGIALDHSGNLYIADEGNHCVRKVNAAGQITTFAGTGIAGNSGDNGPATNAKLFSPIGVAADGSGNIYVGDFVNYTVRKINAAGIITTVAGTGITGFNGDGIAATTAQLGYIWGIATDGSGNLYICDGSNNRVRKVNTSGIISTIAGTGTPGYTGDGAPAISATLNQPINVSVSSSGEIYIADFQNNCVRKINTSGIISTITGTGISGFSGDGGPATAAKLYHPISAIQDPGGNVYIADLDNVRIRKIYDANTLSFSRGRYQNLVSCKNIAGTGLDSTMTIIDYATGVTDKWSLVYGPKHGSANVSYSKASTGNVSTPPGLTYTPAPGYTGLDTFKVAVADGSLSDTTVVYVSVDTLPFAGNITGPLRVCVGQLIKLSDTVKNGNWSSSGDIATVTRGVVAGILAGADIISYTIKDAYCANSALKTVTIDPLPATGTIYAPLSMCLGITDTIREDNNKGSWSNGSGCAVLDSAVVINGYYSAIITATSPGTSIIKYAVKDSFCSAYTTVNIAVDAFPDPGIITGANTVCVGAVIVLTDTVANGTWSNNNKILASIMHTTIPTPNEANVLGISAGNDTLEYSVTNSCGASVANMVITIEPLPDIPLISINKNIFFSVPEEYATYQWAINGVSVAGANADTFTTTEIDTTGHYYITVTNSYGCPVSADTSVYTGCTADAISVFPNPATSVVSIEWCKKVNAQLVYMDGKELKMIKNVNQIDLGDLPNGTYILKIYDVHGNELRTQHISKISK